MGKRKNVILERREVSKLGDLIMFALKKSYELNNCNYLFSLGLKIKSQIKEVNLSKSYDKNKIDYYNIRLTEKEWKTCLFFLDFHKTIKKRKVLKETFFYKTVRISNHYFDLRKSRNDPEWKIEQRNNIRKIYSKISTKVKESLDLNKEILIQRCDEQLLSSFLRRV